MDSSVKVVRYTSATDKDFSFYAYTPIDKTPVSFDEACISLLSDWNKQDLGFKIRAMRAISSKVAEDLNLNKRMPLYVIPKFNELALSDSTPSGFAPEHNAAFFESSKVSAEDVLKTLPHECHHHFQVTMQKLNMLSPDLVPKQYRDKVPEWFGKEYISPLSEDLPGYYSQAVEFDSFQYAYNFLEKHELPSDGAKAALDIAIEARDPATRIIISSPKAQLEKLSSLIDKGADTFGSLLPGGHTIGLQELDDTHKCFTIDAMRKDPVLRNNPTLSNIVGHLAHLLSPKQVFFAVPGDDFNKCFPNVPAIAGDDYAFVNPNFLLNAQTPADFINTVTEHLGVKKAPTVDLISQLKQDSAASNCKIPPISPKKGGPNIG